MSAGRETLPPPPPPPTEVTSNGPTVLPGHLINRTNSVSHSGSRSGSPHSTPTPTPPRQLSRDETPEPLHNDILPPPPPVPDMPPAVAPPPPPPPPPLPSALPNGQLGKAPGSTSPPLNINGDIGKSPNKQVGVSPNIKKKKIFHYFIKAIRDGIKPRKVEKIEQKEEIVKEIEEIIWAPPPGQRWGCQGQDPYSDSDSSTDSEYDSDSWVEQETSA